MKGQFLGEESTKIEKTACGMCGCGCGVAVTVEAGKITRLKGLKGHPLNEGNICPRTANVSNFLYHPERLHIR